MVQEKHHATTSAVVRLFQARGSSRYGGEAVSQLEHALQAAFFAERDGASSTLVTATLLHDVGHLLHNLAENAPDEGIDDRHETLGANWLAKNFGPAVAEPVKMHVAAKRYLCAVDPEYRPRLSVPSLQSLHLQGGAMSAAEVRDFETQPFFTDAVRLRRWDDAAKVVNLRTPDLEYFARHVDAASDSEKKTGG